MKKRRKWIIVLVVLAAVAAAVYLLAGGRRAESYGEATAVTGNMTTYYNFSGSLEVANVVTQRAPVDDTVLEIYVSPGDAVAYNARLMRLKGGAVIRADIAGEVTGVSAVTGGVVAAGDALLEIMDLSTMRAEFQVDEYDVSAVTPGKTAQITVEGTGDVLEAPVTSVDKHAVQSGDLSYYTATAELNGIGLPAAVLPGMQISVNILNQQAENAVLLPMDAVSFNTDNTPYVLMRNGKEVEAVSVTLGINDGTRVQVLSGVRGGETVLYVPTATDALQAMFTRRSQNLASGAQ